MGWVRVQAPAARSLVAGALLTVGFAACAPAESGTEEADAGAPPAVGSFVRGTLLPGNSLRFRSCGQVADLPLRPVDLFTRNLVDEITAGGPIYTEFMGRIGGRVPTMTLTRLVHAARESSGCAGPAPDYEFRAHGNEPFWDVEVRGNTVVWRTSESLGGVMFQITSREQIGDGWLLAARDGDKLLGISFAGTPCRDSMADAWFGYTVQLEIAALEYSGCGRDGPS